MSRLASWKARVRALKRETWALYVASRHPRVPWYCKALAIGIVGYALSPIDLIPDFIPFFGMLDDLIIVPAGFWLVLKLIPADVMDDCRAQATEIIDGSPKATRYVMIGIVLIWIVTLALIASQVIRLFR